MPIWQRNMDIKVLLDTNIIMDIFDANRKRHKNSLKLVRKFLSDDATLYVNSDTLTTSFYLLRGQKKVSFEESLYAIRETVNICELIPIEIDDVDRRYFYVRIKSFLLKIMKMLCSMLAPKDWSRFDYYLMVRGLCSLDI